LCLTCKTLQTFAVPKLYNTVCIPVALLNERLRQNLGPSNTHLEHIRHVQIYDYLSDYNNVKHGEHLSQLIQSLPHDKVLSFWLVTLCPMPLEHTLMLHMSQRSLQNITLHPLPNGGIARTWLGPHRWANITTVELVINSFLDAERGHKILEHVPRLGHLILQQGTHPFARRSIEVLLEPWQKQTPQNTRLQVDALSLRSVDCRQLAEDLNRACDLDNLRVLSIWECGSSQDLLLWLSHRSGKQLEHFRFDGRDSPVAEFRAFLNSFTGLKSLQLESRTIYETNDEDYFDAIGKHGSTLRMLDLVDGRLGKPEWTYHDVPSRLSTLEMLFSKCPNLEHLSIQGPWLSLDTDPQRQNLFPELLERLQKLDKLVGLKLTVGWTFLGPDYVAHPSHHNTTTRQLHTCDAANRIFAALNGDRCRLKGLMIKLLNADIGYSVSSGFLAELAMDPSGDAKRPVPVTGARLRCEFAGAEIFCS
jgi:hypothetical protein